MKLLLKSKCLKIVLFFLFSYHFLGFHGMAQAWFKAPVSIEQPFWNKNTYRQKKTEIKTLFIYDNIVNKENQSSKPYLMPSNEFFISADNISIDMPLIMLSQRSGSSLESIDALLYANLKLDLLLQDYRALRKRTDKLFKTLNIPYLEQLNIKIIKNLNTASSINNNLVNEQFINIQGYKQNLTQGDINSLGVYEEKSGPSIDGISIRSQRDILAYKMTEVARNNSTGHFYLSEKNIPSFAGLDQQSKGLTPGGKDVFTVNAASYKTALKPAGINILHKGRNIDNSSRSSGYPESYREYDSKKLNNHQESEHLPWIFEVTLNTINFVIYNKIEAMFYGAVLFFIIFFISLKARE